MKAYTLDLRERVVKFVAGGGTRAQAARLFRLGERTVYRYLAAAKTNNLAPKNQLGPLAQARSGSTCGARPPPPRRHAPGTAKGFWRQP